MLRDSVVVVVVRTRPRAIPLAMITIRKSFMSFLFSPVMTLGLRLAALRAAGAPLLVFEMVEAEYDVLASRLLDYYNKFSKDAFVPHSVLFRSTKLSSFLARAHSPPPPPPPPPPPTSSCQKNAVSMPQPFGIRLE